MIKIKPVIMAGGSGTRLWPLSRKLYPKQFIKLFDNQSLLQKTLLRNKIFGKPLVIVGEEHRFIAAEQIKEVNIEADLIIEPVAKNTTPCAIIASLIAARENFETVLLLPADHYIKQDEEYLSIIERSFDYAENIATIGIKPTFAHTGYGYIKAGKILDSKIFQVEQFVEKPELVTAESYLTQGSYYWNSGIFIFNADFMTAQAKILQSELFEQVQLSLTTSVKDLDFIRLNSEYYSNIVPISIDYAIMEHVQHSVLIEANFTWNDLGNWNSIWEVCNKDTENNHKVGDVIMRDVSNSYIMSDGRLAAVIGLDNVVIINTSDVLLVADKSKSENVKDVVNQLINLGRVEASEHTRIFRPWGYYQTIDNGELYKVKRIVVYCNQKLSLQYHNYRAEHWIIVKGTAEVSINDNITELHENDSIYIPKGSKHRLSNAGNVDLHLIEVQTGNYLGEDDIVRLNDEYGRK